MDIMAGGRPLLFATKEILQDRIDAYFAYADDSKRPYTLASLACYLDCDTDTLRNYEHYNDGEFFAPIKKARQKIEASKAEKLESKDYSTAGLIFDLLNNHGYKQKTESDVTSKGESIQQDSTVLNAVIASLAAKHDKADD